MLRRRHGRYLKNVQNCCEKKIYVDFLHTKWVRAIQHCQQILRQVTSRLSLQYRLKTKDMCLYNKIVRSFAYGRESEGLFTPSSKYELYHNFILVYTRSYIRSYSNNFTKTNPWIVVARAFL